ncbi:MAG TPA: hypothetical protein VMV77_05275 [Bacteroidales bacterium]|nr:hypothetical protein [Bacteroidales bacterium]
MRGGEIPLLCNPNEGKVMSARQISDDNKAYEEAIQYARLHSDYDFIVLILKDKVARNMAGINILSVTEGVGKDGNIEYKFDVKGGSCRFYSSKNYGGMEIYEMLDDDHNRKFLASMFFGGSMGAYWTIENPVIRKEIREMANKITEDAIGVSQRALKISEKIKELNIKMQGCTNNELDGYRKQLNEALIDFMKENGKFEIDEDLAKTLREKRERLSKARQAPTIERLTDEIAALESRLPKKPEKEESKELKQKKRNLKVAKNPETIKKIEAEIAKLETPVVKETSEFVEMG